MNYKSVLNKSPEELLDWLIDNFGIILPQEILTVEDMNNAAKLLLKLTGHYSYMCSLLSAAKIAKRQAKRELLTKDYQDLVDKCEIIEHMTDVVKQQYNAVSRAVTIHIDNNNELRMSSSEGIRRS